MHSSINIPRVLIVFGLPGSGKSFFASHLATECHAVYINSDQLRMDLFPVRSYTAAEKAAVYDAMLHEAETALQHGDSVVLDGTFYKQAIRTMFETRLSPLARVYFMEVQADEALIQERVGKPRAYSEADLTVYHRIKAAWEPLTADHLILASTNNNLEDMLQQATDYLKMTPND